MTPAEQHAFFHENGYLIVEDLISPADLAELRTMLDKVVDGDLKPEFPNTRGSLDDFDIQWERGIVDDPTLPRRAKLRVVFHLCHTLRYFWNHATRPEILNVIEALMGPDIKLYTDQTFVKPAHHGSEVGFHQDSAYWPAVEPPFLVSCWFAVDDSTLENGCVHVVPGTHKRLLPHHVSDGPQSLVLYDEEVDIRREIPIELKAGSACFHHSCLIHRSFPNRSGKGRRGLVTIYLPSSARFVRPWNFAYGFKVIRGDG